MFAFDKLLSPFLTPLGMALALGLMALLLLVFGRRWPAVLLLVVALGGLYLSSTPVVASWLSGLLEQQYPPQAMAATPAADVILLLGGVTDPALPPRQDPELNGHANRIMHAADLYKAGKAKWIYRLRRQLALSLAAAAGGTGHEGCADALWRARGRHPD